MVDKIKPTASVGMVRSENPMLSGPGTKWSHDAVTYWGDKGANSFSGTEGDDIFFSGGSAENTESILTNRDIENVEIIDGRGGHDSVVLPGRREDYQSVMPASYPGKEAPIWEKTGTDTLYGQVVVLENIHNHAVYQMSGVEVVLFDNGNPLESPKQMATDLPGKIENGAYEAVRTYELHKQAEFDLPPDELRKAKILATREFAESYASEYKTGMGVEAAMALSEKIAGKLDQDGINVDSRTPPPSDEPASKFVLQNPHMMGITPKP